MRHEGNESFLLNDDVHNCDMNCNYDMNNCAVNNCDVNDGKVGTTTRCLFLWRALRKGRDEMESNN